MNRRTLIKGLATGVSSLYLSKLYANNLLRTHANPDIAAGPFKPTWDSLVGYQVPEWFRDAKFGMWAHWGPQCQPERGDWYARGMYQEGSDQYKYHVQKYGHPSKFGFKDVINEWKAENWDPNELVGLYKVQVPNISWHWPIIMIILIFTIANIKAGTLLNLAPKKIWLAAGLRLPKNTACLLV